MEQDIYIDRESRKKEKVSAKLIRASRARQKAEEQCQREIVCKFDSHSVEQTALLGDLLARIITVNQRKGMKTAFLLSGQVGSGKTELIRSIMSFATEQEVHMSSPSFLVVRDYELYIHTESTANTRITIKHIDPHFMQKRLTNYVDLTLHPNVWFIEHAHHDGVAPLIRTISHTCSNYCIINIDITAKPGSNIREFGLKFPLEWIRTGYEFCSTGSIPASLPVEYIGKPQIVSKTPSLHLRYYVQRMIWLKQWIRRTRANCTNRDIIICAIETSFDDTCICLTRNGRIVWEKKVGQDKIHDEYGGVKPDIAASAHEQALNGPNGLIEQSKEECLRLCGRVPDLIAVTQGPGNALSLVPGILVAQRLAWNNASPIMFIDHLMGHILTATMPEFGNDIKFPFLSFIVSGGHTFLVRVDSPVKCTVLWTTPNDTAGEALDKCAGLLDITVVPAAPKLEELARLGCGTRYANHFKSVDTFSQLKICVRDLVAQLGSGDLLNAQILYDLMASTQTRAAEILASTLQSVLLETSTTTEYDSVVVAGGVMSNLEIRARMADVCRMNNIRLIVPPIQYCTDNAPMIANCAWRTIHHRGMTVEGLWEHLLFLNDGPEPEKGNVLQLSQQKFKGLKRGIL